MTRYLCLPYRIYFTNSFSHRDSFGVIHKLYVLLQEHLIVNLRQKLFHHINEYLTKKIKVFTRNNIDSLKNYIKIYEQVLDDYIEETKLNYSKEKYKFTELKRNAIWLTKNIKESTFLRRELGNAKNLNQLRNTLQNLNAN